MIQAIFSLLLIWLPLFKLSWYGGWFARVPQCWLWVSGIIFLFALSQKNIWMKLFLIYCLGIAIYYDFILGNSFQTANGKNIIIRDFIINKSLFTIGTICLIFWLIEYVQKMNTDWLKICILYSGFLVLYFWIFNDFTVTWNGMLFKENKWIAGAYLAFSIPLMMGLSKNKLLNYISVVILFIGVLYTKSTMALLASLAGIIFYFIALKENKESFILLCSMGLIGIIFIPKVFKTRDIKKIYSIITENSYRKELWEKSFFYKKEVNRKPTDKRTLLDIAIGTGLRSYPAYDFLEGSDTLTTHAHNEFLEVWCELGIIGLSIVIGFIVSLYLIQCPIEYKAALTAVIVHCMGYYPARLASTGLLIIIIIGSILKYKNKGECSHGQV